MAYYKLSDKGQVWLTIANAGGQLARQFPVDQQWFWCLGEMEWLTNNELLFLAQEPGKEVTTRYPVVVLDTTSGVTREILSDYPGLQPSVEGPAGTFQFTKGSVVYHPSLDLVVYPRTGYGATYIVLWDRRNQSPLATIRDLGGFHQNPIWAPDGQTLAVPIMTSKGATLQEYTYEWLTVTQGGQVQQLTHFGAVFTHTEIGDSSWSPDGLRLAFWLDAKPSQCEGQTLAILDTTTRTTTDYCLLGSDDAGVAALQPAWSLDGQYLAFGQYMDGVSHTIAVNTQQDWAAQVTENAVPVGWLATQ